eukprot:4853727-Alexandrium_andersonii.AAC.1
MAQAPTALLECSSHSARRGPLAPTLPAYGGRYQHARSSGPVSARARIHTRSAGSQHSRKCFWAATR